MHIYIGYPTPLYHWSLYYPLTHYSTGAAGVVEREALVSSLTQSHLGGVAMDVFWKGALFCFLLQGFILPVLCAPTLFISQLG
jgi:hypothetical protein